ncbi:MAG: PPOX class F420-dependent oxidoreductase [Thermomicrobiales bacterium]
MPKADHIPDSFRDFFTQPVLAHLATLMPDGTPQVTPVWIDYDGEYLLINTIGDRQKGRNLRARARVGLDMVDPDNPFRYLSVRGRVVELTGEGAAAQIDRLALRYLGTPYPRHDPARPRLLVRIQPEEVIYQERIGEIR